MSIEACFQTLPRIVTSRLILRQITESDNDGRDSLEFINDYSSCRYWGLIDTNDKSEINSPRKRIKPDYHYRATMKEYNACRELTWLLELKDTHKVIGEIMLYDIRLRKQADIGYRLSKNYWGKGYAAEAGQAVVKLVFEETDIDRLQIRCFKDNPRSVRVAEKLGFTKEGLIRKGVINNVISDYCIFGCLREDLENGLITGKVITTAQ